MQCKDARDLLDSFLAEQLLVETNHELLRHLEGCPDCRAELEGRRRVRRGLKEAFARAADLQVRPAFVEQLSERLRAEALTTRPRSVPAWLAVAASLLLVAAAATYFLAGRGSNLARIAAGDHQNCAVKFALAERPISLAAAAARYDPAYARLQDTPPNEVPTEAGMLRVAERHSCVFDDRRFGHVVLRLDQHLVSLLMTSDDSRSASAGQASQLAWLPDVNGLSVASYHTPGHVVFIVSDLQGTSFRHVAEALATTRIAAIVHAF